MTKAELLNAIKNYPDDIEIKIWDMMNGNCNLKHIKEEISREVKWSGTVGNPKKEIIETKYLKMW